MRFVLAIVLCFVGFSTVEAGNCAGFFQQQVAVQPVYQQQVLAQPIYQQQVLAQPVVQYVQPQRVFVQRQRVFRQRFVQQPVFVRQPFFGRRRFGFFGGGFGGGLLGLGSQALNVAGQVAIARAIFD